MAEPDKKWWLPQSPQANRFQGQQQQASGWGIPPIRKDFGNGMDFGINQDFLGGGQNRVTPWDQRMQGMFPTATAGVPQNTGAYGMVPGQDNFLDWGNSSGGAPGTGGTGWDNAIAEFNWGNNTPTDPTAAAANKASEAATRASNWETAGTAFGIANNVFQGYLGWKGLGIAEDQLDLSKDAYAFEKELTYADRNRMRQDQVNYHGASSIEVLDSNPNQNTRTG